VTGVTGKLKSSCFNDVVLIMRRGKYSLVMKRTRTFEVL